jgi:flagellar motility protein MotE (MotC chaperone)
MIVTRRRRQRRNLTPVILPLVAIAALVFALNWPPSRNVIFNGPLKPAATFLGNVGSAIAKPFSFAYQQDQITQRNREIQRLNGTLEGDRKTAEDKDQKIAALQQQITQLQAVPSATPAPPRPQPSSALAGGSGLAMAAAAPVPDDIKRTAAYWASMDAEKAAAIAQRLPDAYVNAVFAQMTPDTVGDIMNALPPKIAARLASQASGQTPSSPAPAAPAGK